MRKTKRILLPEDRRRIAELYVDGAAVAHIAETIGVSRCSVYRELGGGYTGETDRNGRPGYDPDLAQRNLRPRCCLKGRRVCADRQRG